MTNEKEKGATSFESAPQGNTYTANSTASVRERGIYNPLTWRPEKPPASVARASAAPVPMPSPASAGNADTHTPACWPGSWRSRSYGY